MDSRTEKLLSRVDLHWSILSIVWKVVITVSSFALPAWAVGATHAFAQYSPASWVIAGFCGMLFAAVIYAIIAWSRVKWVRSKYDARMLPRSGPIDPMSATFERVRIYLSDFALPSHPLVEDKTFIDCEIIGPANVLVLYANNVTEQRAPSCDAVLLKEDANPMNGYIFRSCTFRRCSFQRITLFFQPHEFDNVNSLEWLNWITPPSAQFALPYPDVATNEAPLLQSPPGTEQRTPP